MEVIHNRAASRFEIQLNGKLAKAEYMDRGKLIVFTHTEVPVELEGQGVGSALAKTALDYARAEGKEVMPLCPFIAGYIRRHREYADLVLAGYRF
ncbi:MAG: GNAT family N-acetyltransferase [Bacteroidia bacterium]